MVPLWAQGFLASASRPPKPLEFEACCGVRDGLGGPQCPCRARCGAGAPGVGVDRWADGQVSGQMDGRVGRQVDRWLDGCMLVPVTQHKCWSATCCPGRAVLDRVCGRYGLSRLVPSVAGVGWSSWEETQPCHLSEIPWAEGHLCGHRGALQPSGGLGSGRRGVWVNRHGRPQGCPVCEADVGVAGRRGQRWPQAWALSPDFLLPLTSLVLGLAPALGLPAKASGSRTSHFWWHRQSHVRCRLWLGCEPSWPHTSPGDPRHHAVVDQHVTVLRTLPSHLPVPWACRGRAGALGVTPSENQMAQGDRAGVRGLVGRTGGQHC